jgi:putative membrane protein
MVGPQDRTFLEQASAGNMMEVQLARLAQTKASSNDVKQFASKLEKDHSAANEKLTKIAQQKGVTLLSSVPPKQQSEIDKLEKMSGDQFDRAYAKMMASHHKKDVSAYQKHSVRSMDTHVKAYVDETLPTLQSHLGEAQQLASNVGRGTGRESGSAARSQSENTPAEKK